MSEQATIEQQGASTTPPASAIVLPGEKLARAEGQPPDKVPLAKKHKAKGAPARVLELLSVKKKLEQQLAEARSVLAVADEEVERLRDELELQRRAEEDRLFIIYEKGKIEEAERARKAEEYLWSCLGATIKCAKECGTYARHPDFESKLKRAEYLSARVLECCLQFSKEVAPELVYILASDEGAHRKLTVLSEAAIIATLYPVANAIADRFKLERLVA